METERFCVPELLFSPGDIGIDQAGVAETAWQALQALHKQVFQRSPAFYLPIAYLIVATAVFLLCRAGGYGSRCVHHSADRRKRPSAGI